MKLLAAFLLCVFTAAAADAPTSPDLAQVRAVYLLSMANGMDQYLANGLTTRGVFQVVTDPKRADAIFTDRLGEAFEARMSELFPEPAPPKATAEKPKDDKAAPAKEVKDTKDAKESKDVAVAKEAKKEESKEEKAESSGDMKVEKMVRLSSFARGKGTLFLVDVKTRGVLWSIYEPPKNTTAPRVERAARRVVQKLEQRLHAKKEKPAAGQ